MTLREEMLDAARRGAARLGGDREAVAAFFRGREGPCGGFRGRSGEEDLYYTLFGVEGLVALGADPPAETADYLRSFGAGEGLDLVHLASLVRCLAATAARSTGILPVPISLSHRLEACATCYWRPAAGRRLAAFRAPDGGFAQAEGAPRATAYGCFLAFGAYEDLGLAAPDAWRLPEILERFRAADGGYANEAGRPTGLTPVTGGIVVLRRRLGLPPDGPARDWLMARLHELGGFAAAPGAPAPDLLSTATALLALSDGSLRDAGALERARRPCLEFLDAVWDERAGGFRGNVLDDVVDCEYTWYGLVALGILSAR